MIASRKAEEFASADARFTVVAMIVGEQDGRQGIESDGTKQALQFPRTIFQEPAIRLRLGDEARQNISPRPVFLRGRRWRRILLPMQWVTGMAVNSTIALK
jgi:hypothetical protein